MNNITTVLLVSVTVMALSGCLWRDDFRDRFQPQPLEQPLRGSLNPDSLDYSGDPICEEELEQRMIQLPDIDCLSEIPEVPEYPAGVGCD